MYIAIGTITIVAFILGILFSIAGVIGRDNGIALFGAVLALVSAAFMIIH